MREVCFCGWAGDVADRAPVYAGDRGTRLRVGGLECPRCSRLDRLEWLPDDARARTLAEAARRRRERAPPAPARAHPGVGAGRR